MAGQAFTPVVLEKDDQQVKALEAGNLEKELARFNEGQPYDQFRVIEKTQRALKIGVMAYFEAGCGMILLHKHEPYTYRDVLEQYFPGVSEKTAEKWRTFATGMADHPQFRAFIAERGGYSIGLTLLESCTAEEIEEFEATGEVRGFTQDQIDKMSVRQLKRALRRAREREAAKLKQATEKAEAQIADLTAEVEALKAALTPAELAAAKKVFGRMAQKLGEACNLARNLDIRLLAADWITRIKCLQELARVENLVQEIQARIYEVEEPIAPRGAGEGEG